MDRQPIALSWMLSLAYGYTLKAIPRDVAVEAAASAKQALLAHYPRRRELVEQAMDHVAACLPAENPTAASDRPKPTRKIVHLRGKP